LAGVKARYPEKDMIKFKLLRDVAILSMMIATQAQAHGITGREVAAPSWSAACVSGYHPSVCGQPMWVYGAPGGRAAKKIAVPSEVDAPHWIGD
jgi:hypothetical protein